MRSRSEDDESLIILPDRAGSSQQQHTQQPPPLLHQRPANTETSKRGPEFDSEDDGESGAETLPSLDERYLQQLKADILHLHRVHRQLENAARETNTVDSRITAAASVSQAPNHVKNLLIHRDTKAYLGWSSQRNVIPKLNLTTSSPTTSLQTQVQRYNYSSDPAQLTTAKIGLENLLVDTLLTLMEFCINHEDLKTNGSDPDQKDAERMTLVRPSVSEKPGDAPSLAFANGCGTSPASIYAGGLLSVLQQTEVLKRTMLALSGERQMLEKVIADKDEELSQLTEQIGFFKDVLARRRPRFERTTIVPAADEDGNRGNTSESVENGSPYSNEHHRSTVTTDQTTRLTALEKDRVESILSIQNLEQQRDDLQQQVLFPMI
ncbi:unnamed protein product [Phytophthora fragariaefolia]|uniref:Unnamed protein product n=1 Tax=Phytophthora fragariaefolia TaxID=1490495 RepID=A0A9W6XGV9_9STRA|nr:unnamed protein product [Phytophthora fragariaefolia]